MASPQDPVVSASTANVTPAEALGSAASTGTGGAAPPSSIPLADLGASAAPQTTAAPATTTTITMPGPTKAPETVGVPPAAAAPASADAITTLPAVDGGKPTDAAGGVVANGTAGTGAKADGTDANAMAADPYADIFAQATEAQQKQDELDEDKVVVLRGLATSTYFSLRRFWHAYLLFSVYLIIVICAMSIQLSLFFTLIDPTGTAVNFSRIAARLSASLLVAILFSIFSSQCWEVLRAFWRGEDALVLRKGGYVRGWPKGLSKFIDIISQIAVIILMDIGPIIAAFGLFKGDNGQFIGYFFTAALTGAGVVVVIKILLEFINGAYQLIMLCVRRKWQPIPTLRQITRKAGYQQLESEQLFTTRKSTRDWFCLWIVDRSQDSAGGMLLACFLIIVVGVFVILGTIISSWFIMAEAVYLAFIFISWGWIKIWDPVIDYAKKEEEFNELTPLERTLIDRDLGGFDTKFNVRPIIYPWSTPTLRYASLMLIFGHIALMIWMSVLIGLKGYSLLLFLNLYIAIPYIVILCLYVYSMHPSNWKSDKAKSWLEKLKVWQLQVDATKSFKGVDGNQKPDMLKPFLSTYTITLTVVLIAIPLVAAVVFLIYFLATSSANANTALVGVFAAFYLVFAIAIVFFLTRAVVGFPTEAFLASYVILMFVILAIFTTGVTYTGDVGGAQANAAPPSTPIPPSTRPFPACEYTLFNQSIVTMAFAAAIAYDLPQNAGNDVLLWLGPQYQIAYQWIEPTLQFYDFRNGNLSIISVRGTADATSALIDMDLWSQIAMFQFVDIVVPLIRVWPIEVTRAIVKFTSIGAWMDDTPLYEPLVDYIQQVQAQGLNVIVTGHSLGGGMASIGGALTGLKSVGYSPPGIVYSSLKFGIQDVYSLDETMISIYAEGDVVPKVDTHYGMQQYIPCEPGSTLACHYITRTILFLQKSCGDPFGRQMIQTYLTPAQIDFINQQTGQPSS